MSKANGNAHWSDADKEFLKERWLLGWTDLAIGPAIPSGARSAKAVEWQRRVQGLRVTNYPERSKTISARHTYSIEQEQDILTRAKKHEKTAAIARAYGVTVQAMGEKITRLRAAEEVAAATPRLCINCHQSFLSIHPKPVHRRCPTCEASMHEAGACMLTVFL